MKLSIIALLVFLSSSALAQTPAPTVNAGAVVTSVATSITSATTVSSDLLITDAAQLASVFSALSWGSKISVLILLLIGLLKVSFLQNWWKSLGSAQAWLAPILGALLGITMLGLNGTITFSGVMAYFAAGGGAVILNELLNMIKVIPGLGSTYVTVIGFIETILGGAGGGTTPPSA